MKFFHKITILVLTAIILASCGSSSLPAANPESVGMPVVSEIGEKFGDATAFTWTDVGGAKETFGPVEKQTILVFWKYGCSSCIEEIQAIQTVSDEYKVPILTVCINPVDTLNSVVAILGSLGLTVPVVLDPTSAVAREYGVSTIPDLMLVDQNGKITGRKKGGVDIDRLLEIVDSMEGAK